MNIPFSFKDDVINKMVIPDFQAAQILPKVWPNGNDGHITWGAATAMLGRLIFPERMEVGKRML